MSARLEADISKQQQFGNAWRRRCPSKNGRRSDNLPNGGIVAQRIEIDDCLTEARTSRPNDFQKSHVIATKGGDLGDFGRDNQSGH